MSRLVDILDEPEGDAYLRLLQFAADQGDLFSLVWQDGLGLGGSAAEVARSLQSDLVCECRTDSWPGTRLAGQTATVRTFRFSATSMRVLARRAGLYQWRGPELPEDLALYRGEGRPWLGSIAHEGDAFIYADEMSPTDLVRAVPGIRLREFEGEAC